MPFNFPEAYFPPYQKSAKHTGKSLYPSSLSPKSFKTNNASVHTNFIPHVGTKSAVARRREFHSGTVKRWQKSTKRIGPRRRRRRRRRHGSERWTVTNLRDDVAWQRKRSTKRESRDYFRRWTSVNLEGSWRSRSHTRVEIALNRGTPALSLSYVCAFRLWSWIGDESRGRVEGKPNSNSETNGEHKRAETEKPARRKYGGGRGGELSVCY